MDIKKIAAYTALVGGMSLGALGFGAGFAHAETGTVNPGSNQQFVQQPAAPTVGTHGDQDVVPRGSVIPVHGHDEFTKAPAEYTPRTSPNSIPDPDTLVHRLPRIGIVIIDPGQPKSPHEATAPSSTTHDDDASGAS